jgi:hypothetical protein
MLYLVDLYCMDPGGKYHSLDLTTNSIKLEIQTKGMLSEPNHISD